MKRIVLLLLVLTIFCAGCKRDKSTIVHDSARNSGGKINVTATIFPPYDFVRQIAKDKVNLTMLLPPGAESHSFEPSPRDIITIQNSAIFIYGGGESDEWVDRILESMDSGNMIIIAMMDSVEAVEEEVVEGMEEEDGEEEGAYDEHVWTSPRQPAL